MLLYQIFERVDGRTGHWFLEVCDALRGEKLLDDIQEELAIVLEEASVLDDALKVLVGNQVGVESQEVDAEELFDQSDVAAGVSQLFSLIKRYTLVEVVDKENADFLLKQIAEKNKKTKKMKMNNAEFSINKPLLREANMRLKDVSVASQSNNGNDIDSVK